MRGQTMRLLHIGEITGNEVLAKDIIIGTDTTLIVAGTIVKREYAQKLGELNIEYVYVNDNYQSEDDVLDTEIKMREECKQRVKETIELYTSYGIEQLTPIISIAESIIEDVLQQTDVIYNISAIRDSSVDIYAHSVNVCTLSVLIAIRMRMPEDRIKDIAIGCLLHDIGITYFMDNENEYLENGDMNPEYKKHVIYGYGIVDPETWMSPLAKNIVLSHHERLNGSGYPFGIEDKKIKKAIRIVSVCDVFDRMVYCSGNKKCKVYEAIEYIMSQAGILFDLSVVNVFLDTVAAYPKGAVVTTNLGDRAIVIRQNRKCPTRPVIRLIENHNGISYVGDKEIDLVKNLTIFITDSEL